MTAAPGIAVTWIWLLLLSGVVALPYGGAPLPLDPALASIAPPECLWYASYAGQTEADPNSPNHTEQLFAEEEIKRFAEELHTQVAKAIRRAAGPQREQRVLAEQLPKLLGVILARPSAAYVERIELKGGGQQGFDASAALVLSAGDQRETVQSAIDELLGLLPAELRELADEEAAGVAWRRLPTPDRVPEVRFGWKDDYLLVAVGDDTPQQLVDRLGGSAPEWLSKLRNEHPIERELSVAYINVQGILALVRPLVEHEEPEAWHVIEKLGLTSVSSLHAVAGYDDVGYASAMHLVTKDGGRPGVLGMLPHAPLEPADLTPAPKDALLAVAMSIDAEEVFTRGVELATAIAGSPRAQEEIERGLWEVENHLGVDVRQDILATLDDACVAYLPSGDLMVSWLNAAAAVRVQDTQKLRQSVAKLVDKAKIELAKEGSGATIVESNVGGHTLYSLQLAQPAPVAPSWCVGDGWLVASLSPQAVRAALARKVEDSLASVESVADALNAEGGVASVAYQDTPRLVRSLYPWINMGLQMASGELRRQGVEFDLAAIPTEEVIVRHLRPSLSTMAHREDGFHFNAHASLPGGGNLAAAAPVGVALLVPAVHQAREAARRVHDMNSMKQILLGILNYESVHGHLPTDIYSEDGKPLLSWRVAILPYMEQQALYGGINQQEPWDSPTNRQFINAMPAVYKSAASPEEGGKTRFLAIEGDDGLLKRKEPVRLKDVLDGTSNTIAVVRAAPAAAVEWTKPADLSLAGEKPLADLSTPDGAFLAAFCDGSVRMLSLAIGEETLKRLANRHDGQLVDGDLLDAPPAPHLHNAQGTAIDPPAESTPKQP